MSETEVTVMSGNPEIPGARLCGDGVNFAMAVPDEEEAWLVLTDEAGEEQKRIELPAEERTGEVSAVFVRGLSAGTFGYYYLIGGNRVPDPYAECIRDGLCGLASADFDWGETDLPMAEPEELLIYKLHVRGFTQKAGSDVRHKGTFRGLAEKLPYIRDLGFNAVELMPVYEWSPKLRHRVFSRTSVHGGEKEPERQNFWGYAAENYYFAPKQLFSSDKDASAEVRRTIRAFHEAGIRIILEMYFPGGTDPRLAHLAVRHWKRFYHVDGFHLIGEGVPFDNLVRDPLLKSTMLFFGGLNEEAVRIGRKGHRHLYEYHEGFQNCGRSLLKSDEGQTGRFAQLLKNNPETHGVVNYMANVNGFTLNDTVSYDWKHNEANGEDNRDGSSANYSWNCGIEGPSRKKLIRELRLKQLKNAFLYIFLAQGTPLLYAGDERMNTQEGNNNAYACDNPVGWVDWNTGTDARELCSFVRELTAFRRRHPIFHMKRQLKGMDYRTYGTPDISFHDSKAWVCSFENVSRTLAVMYNGRYTQEEHFPEDPFFYVCYNAGWEAHDFALPALPRGYGWGECIDSSKAESFAEEPEYLADQKFFTAVPRSVCVLCSMKQPQERELSDEEDFDEDLLKLDGLTALPAEEGTR